MSDRERDLDYDFDLPEHNDEPEVSEEEKERPRDAAIDRAREDLIKFFSENKDDVFYLKQLQVIFEKDYFHWIIQKAVKELGGDQLQARAIPIKLANNKTITAKFIWHPSNRYTKRTIKEKAKILAKMSDPDVGRDCGHYAQLLFSNGLLQKGFLQVGQDTKSYEGRSWTETDHNLDYIFTRDGVSYGCEIKNRFEYIDTKTKDIKIQMCKQLGVRPLFIMRYAPKSYIQEIKEAGGFSLIFQTHIYSLGSTSLVREIGKAFPGMEVQATTAIPDKILNRFLNWHNEKLS